MFGNTEISVIEGFLRQVIQEVFGTLLLRNGTRRMVKL